MGISNSLPIDNQDHLQVSKHPTGQNLHFLKIIYVSTQ